MKFKSFLLSKAVTLCFLGIGMLAAFFFGMQYGVPWQALCIAAAAAILFTALWLVSAFLLQRARLRAVRAQIECLDRKYLAGEIVSRPRGAAEEEYFYIMREVSRSAIAEAETARKEKEQYCQYVENFIHELKTPLTACALMIDNGAEAGKLKPQLKRAENLTECILYYARLRSAQNDRRIAETSAAQICREAVRGMKEILVAANVRVSISGDFSLCTDDKAYVSCSNSCLSTAQNTVRGARFPFARRTEKYPCATTAAA